MPSITHIVFPDTRSVASACGRFSEYRTNPDLRGTVFGWDDLKKWEIARFGAFRYLDYWEGYMLHGRDFAPFRHGTFDPLTPEERRLLELVSHVGDDDFVIASAENDRVTYQHELIHALYETDADYRREVEALFGRRLLPNLRTELLRMGYREDAAANEANSYLASGLETEMKRGWREILGGWQARRLLRKRFGWDPRKDESPRMPGRIRTVRFS